MFAPAGRSSKACLRLCLRCELYGVHLEAYLSSSAVIDFDHWNSQFEKYKQRVLRWRFSKLCNASFELPGTALHSLCSLDWGIFSETLHRRLSGLDCKLSESPRACGRSQFSFILNFAQFLDYKLSGFSLLFK